MSSKLDLKEGWVGVSQVEEEGLLVQIGSREEHDISKESKEAITARSEWWEKAAGD